MAAFLLLATQAQATSFIVMGGEPLANPRSVLHLGRPIAPVAASRPSAAPPPDRSIQTAALRLSDRPPGDLAPARRAGPRPVVAWPPLLSRSMVAFGEPLPVETPTMATAERAPFGLPMVIRGGLAGDAFKSAPTPARAAVEETPRRPAADRSPRTETPAVAERREPSRRDRPTAPEAPPSVPATPPPTMRLE